MILTNWKWNVLGCSPALKLVFQDLLDRLVQVQQRIYRKKWIVECLKIYLLGIVNYYFILKTTTCWPNAHHFTPSYWIKSSLSRKTPQPEFWIFSILTVYLEGCTKFLYKFCQNNSKNFLKKERNKKVMLFLKKSFDKNNCFLFQFSKFLLFYFQGGGDYSQHEKIRKQ